MIQVLIHMSRYLIRYLPSYVFFYKLDLAESCDMRTVGILIARILINNCFTYPYICLTFLLTDTKTIMCWCFFVCGGVLPPKRDWGKSFVAEIIKVFASLVHCHYFPYINFLFCFPLHWSNDLFSFVFVVVEIPLWNL